ncbi:unnamed protein product [Chondrus crispus]|uniref:Uncharacterized protein n=1 Tax=Chondrus crispus TaxID=2769 RepID=R7Q4V8_CHOCR|nr:unnamed protein product [Chondrus crispus]CDF33572.1 unnamed protein product [Chondrus crispus]|eukprot:XP_005713375.1 unnamed protein product [Chondrus crispus]
MRYVYWPYRCWTHGLPAHAMSWVNLIQHLQLQRAVVATEVIVLKPVWRTQQGLSKSTSFSSCMPSGRNWNVNLWTPRKCILSSKQECYRVNTLGGYEQFS